MDVTNIISSNLKNRDGIWHSDKSGYWSFFEQEKTQKMIARLNYMGCLELVRREFPQHEDLIFSPKRCAGVGMLDFNPGDVVVDAGCMWGALTVPIAKTKCNIIGLDQTIESLLFLNKRKDEENLTNVELVCADLNEIDFKDCSINKFIVNGVLEWIPESCKVEVEKYYNVKENYPNIFIKIKDYYRNNRSPQKMQRDFLKKLHSALAKDGVLYLAIENRYFAPFFLGYRDQHTGLRFVDILPRFLQTIYSFLMSGKPFVTWTYSERELKKMIHSSGFSKVEIKYAFPDYHFPELILSKERMDLFKPVRYRQSKKKHMKIFWWLLEKIFYDILHLKSLSPAFVAIAQK